MSTSVHLERSTGKISIVNFLNSECYSCMKAVILNLFPTQHTLVIYILISIRSFIMITTELPDNLQILTQCPPCTGCVLAQSPPTLWDPMDCSPPGSSGHAILPGKNTGLGSISSSNGSSQPRDQTCICCFPALAGGFFTTEPPEKKHNDEQNVLFIVWGTNCLERCALWPFFITHFTLWHTHLLSHGQLFATLWTGARQAPLSIGVSRQEYWSGLPFSSPGDFSPPRDQTSVSCVSCIGRQIL